MYNSEYEREAFKGMPSFIQQSISKNNMTMVTLYFILRYLYYRTRRTNIFFCIYPDFPRLIYWPLVSRVVTPEGIAQTLITTEHNHAQTVSIFLLMCCMSLCTEGDVITCKHVLQSCMVTGGFSSHRTMEIGHRTLELNISFFVSRNATLNKQRWFETLRFYGVTLTAVTFPMHECFNWN